MDSISGAAKYFFIVMPVTAVCMVMEAIGIAYVILFEYPFQEGKCKAQGVYKKLKK